MVALLLPTLLAGCLRLRAPRVQDGAELGEAALVASVLEAEGEAAGGETDFNDASEELPPVGLDAPALPDLERCSPGGSAQGEELEGGTVGGVGGGEGGSIKRERMKIFRQDTTE